MNIIKKTWPAIVGLVIAEIFCYFMWQSGGYTTHQAEKLGMYLVVLFLWMGHTLTKTNSRLTQIMFVAGWLAIYFCVSYWHKTTQGDNNFYRVIAFLIASNVAIDVVTKMKKQIL